MTGPDPDGGVSFFAERLAEACAPWPVTDKIEIPAPSDVAVAGLDDAEDAFDDLELLTGNLYDLVLDHLDDTGQPPARCARELLDHFHLTRAPLTGWRTLVEMINVYGGGIEYDLWDRGHDLADYFRGHRPWDHLLRMLARLPMGSHYRAAIADDDVLAEQIAAVHGPLHKRRKGSGRPPLTEFTREISYLHRIDNRLEYLAWAVFAAQAGKKRGSPPKGTKGPETADERVDFRGFLVEHEEVVGQVLKSKGGSKKPSGPAPEAVRGAVLLDPSTNDQGGDSQ